MTPTRTTTERREDTAAEPPGERDPALVDTAGGWLAASLALVIVLALSLSAGLVLLRPVLDMHASEARRTEILAAAKDIAQRSYALDYQSFAREAPQIIDGSAGNYRQGLLDSQKGLQYILDQGKVKSTCTITAAGVEREDGNTATVLLSIISSVSNTEVQGQTRAYRVAMNLKRDGERWLVLSNDVIA